MAGLSPPLSILTLNANGLNSLSKGYRVAGWIKKTRPNYMLPLGDLALKTNIGSKWRDGRWYPNQMAAKIKQVQPLLISDKTDFKKIK